jgi:tRNA (cytidine/uridine-2'-O-)-methyltransferase
MSVELKPLTEFFNIIVHFNKSLNAKFMRLALYQPDIPQNTGAAVRLCACLGIGLDIIEPCGFLWNTRKIKKSALDYYDAANIIRHSSWDKFYQEYKNKKRFILMTTKSSIPYTEFCYDKDDILIAGRESVGAPDTIHDICQGRVLIPMHNDMRSLNVINASSMIVGEALRQINTPL